MNGLADLAEQVAALQAEGADLRAALQHARDLATQERAMRLAAEERVARAWRTVSTWPHRVRSSRRVSGEPR